MQKNNQETPESLWPHYVLRKGNDAVSSVWRELFEESDSERILFITGAGFDPRVRVPPNHIRKAADASQTKVDALILEFSGYKLNQDLKKSTAKNKQYLKDIFGAGNCTEMPVDVATRHRTGGAGGEAGKNTSLHVRDRYFEEVNPAKYDHVVLDISSLPRIVYLTLFLQTLGVLVPDRLRSSSKIGEAKTFHVVVAEDPRLDSQIKSSELGHDVTNIAGFVGGKIQAAHARRSRVMVPVLGEGREQQLKRVLEQQNDETEDVGKLELCPVLPHPSENPRRADQLVASYGDVLFEEYGVEPHAFVYADEANPFEAYRQIRSAFKNYTDCFSLLDDGCRIEVVPLSSKLITIGTALACFEWYTTDRDSAWRIILSYPEPSHYQIDESANLDESEAEMTLAVITGSPYRK